MKNHFLCVALSFLLCALFLVGCGNAVSSKGYTFDDFALENISQKNLTQEDLDTMFSDSSVYENVDPDHSSKYDVYYAHYNILDKAYYINAFGAQFDSVFLENLGTMYLLAMRADIRDYSSKEQDKLLEKMDAELSKWGEPAKPVSVAILCYEKPIPSGGTAHIEVTTPFGYLMLSEMIIGS